MDAEFVRQFPALTFASGPTNSLRGACKLTGLDNAIVVDIGGTTSDIGILQDGFPRESNIVIEVGGVRTNFRMPDILALGLGGGSLVASMARHRSTVGGSQPGNRGPGIWRRHADGDRSVVAAGKIDLGPANMPWQLPPETIRNGLQTIHENLNQGIEKMMPSSDPLPVVLVGGGAILVSEKLTAASQMHCPEHSGVANAIGAAIAQIGGETERLVSYKELPRGRAIRQVSDQARAIAIGAGADPTTIRIADIEETTISYMAEGSTRLRVKAVGDIAQPGRRGEAWPSLVVNPLPIYRRELCSWQRVVVGIPTWRN